MVEVYKLGAYIDGLNNNSKSLLEFSTEIINNSNKLKTELNNLKRNLKLEKLGRLHKMIIRWFKVRKINKIMNNLFIDINKLVNDVQQLHNNILSFNNLINEWLSSIRGWINRSRNNPNNQNILQKFIETFRKIQEETIKAENILGGIKKSLKSINKDLDKINKNIEELKEIMREMGKENENILNSITNTINKIRSLIKKAESVVEAIESFLHAFRINIEAAIETLKKGVFGLITYLTKYFMKYYF